MITSTLENKIADTRYDVHPLIAQRWSPRVFSDKEVTGEDMNQLLEAVRWSASSRNEQPWRLIYAHRGSKAYERMMSCLSEFNRKWAGNAPVLILAGYKEKFESGKDNFHALHDLGLALGNMTVQAQSMDIALHHMAGVDWKKAHEKFDVPAGYHIATAIAVGYYGGSAEELPESLYESAQAERTRIPQASFSAEGKWPEDNN
ncbi:nitroreductase family protein [Flavilitoribacter nigricans]|uniref:Nitroreductase n=1 Tax=Flavilitoribacter nigricans (strain ATCC 23147 / DSM 23189 / NBRC 102662 / NCIMB 1420 / SS-2) TaxID=1122177 RepID=A0A2D0NA36_FLAN2|nr:nitroreductase family protein [Flavilitoribacter nigricans]PHN05345.1 nitroreductase [Flavilitoribacter nigricans DSM 23189 = NBRC 102662]